MVNRKKQTENKINIVKDNGYNYFLFRTVLGIIILVNFMLGIAAFLGPDTALNAIKAFYGTSLNLNPQLSYIIKILGAYLLGFGILGIFAWNNPVKNKAITDGIGILLLMRSAQRILFVNEISTTFGLSSTRLIWGILIYLAAALALFILNP